MTDEELDLDRLEASCKRDSLSGPPWHSSALVLQLVHRIREVEAERDKNKEACVTLGWVMDGIAKDMLANTQFQRVIATDGDWDWTHIQNRVAELCRKGREVEAKEAEMAARTHQPHHLFDNGTCKPGCPCEEAPND